jgi:hypothetical protein
MIVVSEYSRNAPAKHVAPAFEPGLIERMAG